MIVNLLNLACFIAGLVFIFFGGIIATAGVALLRLWGDEEFARLDALKQRIADLSGQLSACGMKQPRQILLIRKSPATNRLGQASQTPKLARSTQLKINAALAVGLLSAPPVPVTSWSPYGADSLRWWRERLQRHDRAGRGRYQAIRRFLPAQR